MYPFFVRFDLVFGRMIRWYEKNRGGDEISFLGYIYVGCIQLLSFRRIIQNDTSLDH